MDAKEAKICLVGVGCDSEGISFVCILNLRDEAACTVTYLSTQHNGVGKTCIASRFATGLFPQDVGPTVGYVWV